MTSIQLTNIPEDVLDRLKTRANYHGHSVEEEALAILEKSVGRGKMEIEDLHRYVQSIDLRTPDDATRIIRDARDRV